jgi:hypothetical protein
MPEVTGLSKFPFDAANSAIAIGYRNEKYIADLILPRKLVGKQAFWWSKRPNGAGFTVPNTLAGRRGALNFVPVYGHERPVDQCFGYGLRDRIPVEDEKNADPGADVVGESVELITDLLMLDREVRVAAALTDLALYPTGNKVTLSGTDQWSNDASTPISDIKAARLSMRTRPRFAACGRDVIEYLASHPDIVAASYRNSGTKGDLTVEEVARVLHLEQIFVGETWVNTANEGQTEVISPVWGKDFLLFYQNPLASFRNGVTLGLTAQWGDRIAGRDRYTDEGLMGGTEVRVGEYVKEVILCPECGYLIKAAVA